MFLKEVTKGGSLPYIKSKTNQNGYTNLIPSDINKLQTDYEECQLCVELGDVMVFHYDLVHKSNFNNTENTRLTGIVRLLSMGQIYDKLHFSPADH